MPTSRAALWGLLAIICCLLATQPTHVATLNAKADTSTPTRYIIQLNSEPLAAFVAQNASAASQNQGQISLESAPARAYQAALDAQHQQALQTIAQQIGGAPPVIYSYDVAFNGMALELTAAQANQVAGLPGILAVQPEPVYELTSDAGPTWIGADQIWDGSASGVYAATVLGQNMSPAVSSALTGRGTFSYDATSSTLAYTLIMSGPTATISAARIYRTSNSSILATLTPTAPAGSYAGQITLLPTDLALLQTDQLAVMIATSTYPGGEARGAISGYKGEGVTVGVIDTGINTTHPSFAEVGGDGYHHLNPLGQGTYKGACDPTNLPSRASGNPSGYNPAITCNNKLIGAWTFSETSAVSNFSTSEPSPNDEHNHGSHTASTAIGNVRYNVVSGGVTYPQISGVAPHANVIAYDVCGYIENGTYAASCPGSALLAAVNQAVADHVDVISYSISGGESPWGDSIEQAFLVARQAGVVVSTSAGNSGPTSGTVAHLSPWLMSVAAATHNRRLSGSTRVLLPSYGDIMANFSSRGPASGTNPTVLKPDLTAPGVSVFAAYANTGGASPNYGTMSGTSMSAPHVSGAAALLAGLHPGWTPGQIQSALMTTSLAPITKENGSAPTTPFDSGAGRVRLERAARAGLVLDETATHFMAANPDAGGDPRTLNIPSMADARCVFSCSWTRTLHNALNVPVSWVASTETSALSISPASFTIAAAGSQVVTFTLNVSSATIGTYVFNRATLTAADDLAPSASFPVAALPTSSSALGSRTITANSSTASETFDLTMIGYTQRSAQIYGLSKGVRHNLSLANDAFDTSISLSVSANTARLVAEIQSSTSQDIDLYLIYDANANGHIDYMDAWACQSSSLAVDESCSLDSPTAGTYFVQVHNYQASSTSATDPVVLLTAVIPNTSAGNMTLDAPTSSPGGPVSVTLNMNLPSSSSGDFWYGKFSLIDTASSTQLANSTIDFHHMPNGATALIATDGSAQWSLVNTAFASSLVVRVTDSVGGRVVGVPITFSGPESGAGVTFPGGASATTDQNGVAKIMARANEVSGSYLVTASASGTSGSLTAVFPLENVTTVYVVSLPLVIR
ncbi:MAG: S8 family serine peptidase [Oscillochloris sp.]|nr:S8 family serine peptidase [Oscillochloris sp.]